MKNTRVKQKDLYKEMVLEERTYYPEIFSESFKWRAEAFRDRETGARVMFVFPYSLPRGEGWRAVGMHDSSTNTFYIDRTHPEIYHTYKHEQGHAKGGDEYLAEIYASKSNHF